MKLAIEKLIYGGRGLARIPAEAGADGGMRAFVPFTLPGEIVEATITEKHRGYCVGELHQIDLASEFRASPSCPYFGTCGGCQLQHSTYPYQIEMKREMLAESLRRAGIRELPKITSLAGEPFAYRNRIRLHILAKPEFAIGYRKENSHRITAIDHCPVALPLLGEYIAAIHALGLEHWVPADLQEVELFTNHNQSELLMTLWSRRGQLESSAYTEFFSKLQHKLPQLYGAVVYATEKERSLPTRPLLQWGTKDLRYLVGGREYTVGAGSFFQINAHLLDAFVASVVENQAGQLAWDLYAGVGLFSLPLTKNFQDIVAVESDSRANKYLRKNLQNTKATAIHATTLEFLQKATRQPAHHRRPSPDLVVLDPPRAGAGVETCRLLALCKPRRILYVSCDPATLGRDLAPLIQSGYRLNRLQMVDMFPQTGHLETIAMLDR